MDAKQVFEEYVPRARTPRSRQKRCCICGTELSVTSDASRKCPGCGTQAFANPLPAVCIIVSDDNSDVLCRRRSKTIGTGQWCLPAGFIEYDEDFLTAGRREVQGV